MDVFVTAGSVQKPSPTTAETKDNLNGFDSTVATGGLKLPLKKGVHDKQSF